MKTIIGFVAICFASMATGNVLAQQPTGPPATAQAANCAREKKLDLYNEFRQNLRTDTTKANELAKKWLACPEASGEEQITTYLKKFVALYEEARRNRIHELVYTDKDYPTAIELAKAALVEKPDNLQVLIDFSYAGYASKNEAYRTDTLAYTKKALQLIESGQSLPDWKPYVSKAEVLGYLYNTIGSIDVLENAAKGLPTLIKAVQFEGKIRTLPFTYGMIAEAYETGPYAKLSEAYKAKYAGREETPDAILALDHIYLIVDRMIDAYARAVALAGNDPKYQAAKTAWMDSLIRFYKFRHNQTDSGLAEMIRNILATPLAP